MKQSQDEWMTPDLLTKLASNPKLLSRFQGVSVCVCVCVCVFVSVCLCALVCAFCLSLSLCLCRYEAINTDRSSRDAHPHTRTHTHTHTCKSPSPSASPLSHLIYPFPDPYFMQAISEFQHDQKAALQKYANNSEVSKWDLTIAHYHALISLHPCTAVFFVSLVSFLLRF
jgi:MFS superfamily sulfate permease-like transporter